MAFQSRLFDLNHDLNHLKQIMFFLIINMFAIVNDKLDFLSIFCVCVFIILQLC